MTEKKALRHCRRRRLVGTVRDLRRLFRDLETRVRDDADNGFVAKE